MKKHLFLTLSILVFTAQSAFCALDTVAPGLATSLKSDTAEPNYLSIVFALLFVVFLIYITGVIYSKLNLAGARKVQEQLKEYDLSKVIVVSTTQLGQGKNLHVIELHKKRYLIGATQNSITLLKELDEIKEKPSQKPQSDVDIDRAIKTLYGKENALEPEEEIHEEEFDLHKKYL